MKSYYKKKSYYEDLLLVLKGIAMGAANKVPGVSGGIVAETRQTMMNIKNRLEKMGGSMDDIFKCTCMLADIKRLASYESGV